MRTILWTLVAAIVVMGTLLMISPATAQAPDVNLTGKWRCDDEGTYYVRQIGKTVWWMGKSKEGGKEWSNVFRGEIRGRQIIGDWADVPRGEIMGSGTLHLEMRFRDGRVVELRKTKQIGDGFGGGLWKVIR